MKWLSYIIPRILNIFPVDCFLIILTKNPVVNREIYVPLWPLCALFKYFTLPSPEPPSSAFICGIVIVFDCAPWPTPFSNFHVPVIYLYVFIYIYVGVPGR